MSFHNINFDPDMLPSSFGRGGGRDFQPRRGNDGGGGWRGRGRGYSHNPPSFSNPFDPSVPSSSRFPPSQGRPFRGGRRGGGGGGPWQQRDSWNQQGRGRGGRGNGGGRGRGRGRGSTADFNVGDYVIPVMTGNPWAALEREYYASLKVVSSSSPPATAEVFDEPIATVEDPREEEDDATLPDQNLP